MCLLGVVQAVGASTRVFALLDRQPQMVPAGQAKPRGSPEGAHIEFRNVVFSYPSRTDIQVIFTTWLHLFCNTCPLCTTLLYLSAVLSI